MLLEAFRPRVPYAQFQHRRFGGILFDIEVVVLVRIFGEDVKLTGVHVTQIGIEARGVKTHPQSEAKVSGARRITHYGDIGEQRQVRVFLDSVARTRVLAEGIRFMVGCVLMPPKEMYEVRTLSAQVDLKRRGLAVVKRGEAGQRRQGGENVN